MLETVTPPPLSPDRLRPFVSDRRQWDEIQQGQAKIRDRLRGRALLHVSSKLRAGGLAELLRSQVSYARGVGIDAHWEVIEASPEFFALAKRIHNMLHGRRDHGPFDEEVRFLYEDGLAIAGRELVELIKPGDVVVLHDPQTAGLAPMAERAGAHVVWRCHVGLDTPNDTAREAWTFLRPYLAEVDAYVFSRPQFAWETLDQTRTFTIPPVINPLAPKNQELSESQVAGILALSGLQANGATSRFVRLDGTPGRVDRPLAVAGGGELPPEAPLVLQVSAWNHLKDPAGVVRLFAERVAPHSPAHLAVAGPGVEWIPDETEAEAVYAETLECVDGLAPAIRERVHLLSIPNDDPEEAGAIINALQRRASVAVQHSRGEGFGLAVMEAMWKRRPVVCSRVGGLQEQVVHGTTGLLVEPGDENAAAEAILTLLTEPETARAMGDAGRDRVASHYLLPHDAPRWIQAFENFLPQREAHSSIGR